MSSNHRITENVATIAGPPPSANGKHAPPANDNPSFSPGSQNRGGQRPTPIPSATDPDQHPSTNGRDPLGRFSPGNAGGPGNPFARLVAELRKTVVEAVPPDKLRAIFVKMSDLALEGNVQAAKFIASYLIGKPQPAPDPDRADLEEWQQFKEEAPMMKEVMQHMKTPDPILPLTCARAVRYATTLDQSGMLNTMISLPRKEQNRLFELGAASPHEVCNLLRDTARHPDKPPSANGKRKKHRT